MAARGFTALPVVDADGDLIGRKTEADLAWHRSPRDPRYRGTDEADAARSEGPVDEPATPGRGVTTSPATAMVRGVTWSTCCRTALPPDELDPHLRRHLGRAGRIRHDATVHDDPTFTDVAKGPLFRDSGLD